MRVPRGSWSKTAGHAGAIGIAASGKLQETPGAVFYTFEGNKIKSSRQYFDSLTLMKQIGAESK